MKSIITATQAQAEAGAASNVYMTPERTNQAIQTLSPVGSAVTGEIKMWPTAAAPTGYLLCDGSAVSRVTYSDLFALLSDSYGGGNGSTTFNVPNFKNRVPIGLDTSVKLVLDDCESAWTAGTNVTATNDAVFFKTGTKSVKLAVAAGAVAGQILGYKALGSTNFTAKSEIGFWVYSTIPLNAGDLQYRMDDTAAIASPLETINLPAIAGDVWTKVYVSLANPGSDTAIISHGLYQVVDKGAFNLWIDDISYGENYELGAQGGAKTHTLSTPEIPSHTHTIDLDNGNFPSPHSQGASANPMVGGTTGATGGGLAHNILNPFLAINYIIKT